MRIRLISRSMKCTYKTSIRPVLVYGAETWIIIKINKRLFLTFERKVYRNNLLCVAYMLQPRIILTIYGCGHFTIYFKVDGSRTCYENGGGNEMLRRF